MYMEIREQLALDSSLLAPCMSLGQISGCQAWWPVPLLSEPASQIPYRYKEISYLPKNTHTHAHTISQTDCLENEKKTCPLLTIA